MTIPSVITIENTDGIILSVKFSREIFFLARFIVYKTVGVWFFFSDRISDGTGNYQRLIFRRIDSAGEAIGKNFTDNLCALYRRNYSVDKTI
jgi:hypothetical protein